MVMDGGGNARVAVVDGDGGDGDGGMATCLPARFHQKGMSAPLVRDCVQVAMPQANSAAMDLDTSNGSGHKECALPLPLPPHRHHNHRHRCRRRRRHRHMLLLRC